MRIHGGSGTVVYAEGGYAVVLTCKHVWGGVGNEANVRFPDGRVEPAELLSTDKTSADLAAYTIVVGDRPVPFVSVADESPVSGAEVVQVGYPNGHGPKLRFGVLRSPRGVEVDCTVRVATGDSGSGVFNTNGGLVGVICKNARPTPGDSGEYPSTAVSYPACKRFIDATLERLRARIQNRPKQMPKLPPEDIKPIVPETKPDKTLADKIDKIAARLEEIAKMKAVPGKDGLDGKPGKDGVDELPGKDGRAGKDADSAGLRVLVDAQQAQIEALRSELAGQQAILKNLSGRIKVIVTPK